MSQMFRGFAKKVQYFYYTKMRLATCMPSKCAKSDLDLIGEQSKYQLLSLFCLLASILANDRYDWTARESKLPAGLARRLTIVALASLQAWQSSRALEMKLSIAL